MATRTKEQPSEELQRAYKAVQKAKHSTVEVRGKQWKVRPPHLGVMDRISELVLEENIEEYAKNPRKYGAKENKLFCKCAALFRLNGLFKIMLFYWLVWRWYYYIKEYEVNELLEYFTECKKKAPVQEYLMATILLTEMKDTKMQMTRKEVNRIQAEHLMAQRSTSAKTTPS